MKRLLCAVGIVLVAPVVLASQDASQSIEIVTEFNGLDIQWEPLGVEGVSSEKVDLTGTPAVTVTNNSNERVLCEFTALPEQHERTPTELLEPNSRVVMKVPGKYTEGGPIAVLECERQ
ncbi:hypothetical protein KEM63_05105 [Halopseudomonas nanhaiensis]|uniref:hypothetical protein n=1 Tax=Halopseudomonas nanhaiensis TaxID=2830842 RepID=UPI001CC1A99F|nr:hypothetical protein [Halopseudomonas nanhaiensis]UAW99350.1 hypothetical protein KEM63_05105 [Halopseudomonas nanhaiensis]